MEVLLDPGQALVTDGPTLDTTIAVAGGSARYLFAGVAGQNLGLGVSNLALNPAKRRDGDDLQAGRGAARCVYAAPRTPAVAAPISATCPPPAPTESWCADTQAPPVDSARRFRRICLEH